jgi:glycosyltransferase involved in cell wall biosynthesis
MQVLTVVAEQLLAPVPGGTGRYSRSLLTALPAAAPPGWAVRTTTAFHRDVRAVRVPGVTGPVRLPLGARGLAAAWEKLGLPPVPGDSVHATTPLAPRRGQRPLVVTVHDAVPWTHPDTLTPRGVRWHRAMITRAAAVADAIVVPTAAVADDLSIVLPALRDRLHVVPHGVSDLPVPGDAADRRRRLGLPERYVLSLATLEPRKGLDVLVRALAAPGADRVPLVVVGQQGWGSVSVPELARDSGVATGRITVTGRIPDDDLAAVLAGAGLLVMPSRAEGFGLPVLEAMAAGVPVLHTDLPVLREVSAGAAATFPAGDDRALGELLAQWWRDPQPWDDRIPAARTRSADFSWAAAARATWAVHLGAA